MSRMAHTKDDQFAFAIPGYATRVPEKNIKKMTVLKKK